MTPLVSRVAERAERALAWCLILLMAMMVLDVTWQVASRFLFGAPSSFTEELAGYLLIWIGMLGAAYALRTRAHLAIDVVVMRLSRRARRAAAMTAHGLVAAFALAVMLVGGLLLTRLAFDLDQISASLGIRVGFVYLAMPIAGALMMLFSLESVVKDAAAHRDG